MQWKLPYLYVLSECVEDLFGNFDGLWEVLLSLCINHILTWVVPIEVADRLLQCGTENGLGFMTVNTALFQRQNYFKSTQQCSEFNLSLSVLWDHINWKWHCVKVITKTLLSTNAPKLEDQYNYLAYQFRTVLHYKWKPITAYLPVSLVNSLQWK